MIFNIGCDIVQHNLSKQLKWDTDIVVLRRIFSKKELQNSKSRFDIKYLSGRFAAKEAVVKCLGNGMYDGISLTDIQILQLPNGAPIINLNGKVKEISDKLGIKKWHVTISHTSNDSMAFAVAEA